jgi:hypothetical protein
MFASLSLLAAMSIAAEPDAHRLRVTVAESLPLPETKAVVAVKAGDPGPGDPKHKAVATLSDLKEPLSLPNEGPFDVWWQPKDGGLPVRVAKELKVPATGAELKLAEEVGVVRVRGESLPRLGLLVLTPPDDLGPDETGHTPVQTATAYRAGMVVPAGFYSLWVKPFNGARAQRVEKNFKVLAGKVREFD